MTAERMLCSSENVWFLPPKSTMYGTFSRDTFIPLSLDRVFCSKSLLCLISPRSLVVLVNPPPPSGLRHCRVAELSLKDSRANVKRPWGNASHQWRNESRASSLVSASSLIAANLTASDLVVPPAFHYVLPFSEFCSFVTWHFMF